MLRLEETKEVEGELFIAETPENVEVEVGNLVITNVSTSNGTEDYFKFDANSDDDSLTTPEIKFTIEDQGDAHFYRWRVRVRSTDDEQQSNSVVYEGVDSAKEISVKINNSALAGEGSPQQTITEKGTYNFEIRVFEYKTEADAEYDIAQTRPQAPASNALVSGRGDVAASTAAPRLTADDSAIVTSRSIDVINLRSVYLFIPYKMKAPYENYKGHDGEILADPNDVSRHWFMSHYFEDDSRANEVVKTEIIILDPQLEEIATHSESFYHLNSPTFNRDVHHFEIEGFQRNRYYIGVTTAMDDHQQDYRDHKARSMLAKNNRSLDKLPEAEFTGDKRASAGGSYVLAQVKATGVSWNGDQAHIATFKAFLEAENPKDPKKKIALDNQNVQLRFKTNAADDPAQFVIALPDGSTDYTADPVQTTTDAEGYVTVEVLSSRKAGSAEISVWVEVKTAPEPVTPPVTPPVAPVTPAAAAGIATTPLTPPEKGHKWEELVQTYTVEFAKPVGKRLFGQDNLFGAGNLPPVEIANIGWLNQWLENSGYDEDDGWNFDPMALERVGNPDVSASVVKCQFFLRFLKAPDESGSDRNYYQDTRATPPTEVLSIVPLLPNLDADGDQFLSAAELAMVQPRGSESAPLEDGTIDGETRKIWFGVAGHALQFRIASIAQTETQPTPAITQPPLDPRAVSFCDKDGNYLQVDGSGKPQLDAKGNPIFGINRPTRIPSFMPITTDANGVATFYLRAGFLSHRMNQINLSAEDTTTK